MVKIVVECGVNHGGSLEEAFKYIDAAASIGADAIKFQTWFSGEITGLYTSKANYMLEGLGESLSRYEISERLRLPVEAFIELKNYADKKSIEFMSTPDGPRSLEYLIQNNLLKVIKVGSTEINNLEFLAQVKSCGLPVYLSTGTATLSEVVQAVEIFAGNLEKLTLLQCTSAYPCPDNEVNLAVISEYKKIFGCEVGFSDHSSGISASLGSVCMGVSVLEKHLYLDSDKWTPDANASLSLSDFSQLVTEIRRLELMLGDSFKHRTLTEKENLSAIRRVLVAKQCLKEGHVLTSEDIVSKRASYGLSLNWKASLIGRKLSRDIQPDEPIITDSLD